METQTVGSVNPFWSAWFDYSATGEGMTFGVMYCLADDREQALEQARSCFGDFYSLGTQAEPGLKTDGYFSSYVPAVVIKHYQGMIDGTKTLGSTQWHGVFHINYS